MSIQADIEALEKALSDEVMCGPWEATGPSFGDPLPRYLDQVVQDLGEVGEDGFAEGDIICLGDPLAKGHPEVTATIGYIAACSPDRIRRVLDALVEGESQHLETLSELGMQRTATQVAEAKLSKAIELLREANDYAKANRPDGFRVSFIEEADSFLKEQGEPK